MEPLGLYCIALAAIAALFNLRARITISPMKIEIAIESVYVEKPPSLPSEAEE